MADLLRICVQGIGTYKSRPFAAAGNHRPFQLASTASPGSQVGIVHEAVAEACPVVHTAAVIVFIAFGDSVVGISAYLDIYGYFAYHAAGCRPPLEVGEGLGSFLPGSQRLYIIAGLFIIIDVYIRLASFGVDIALIL